MKDLRKKAGVIVSDMDTDFNTWKPHFKEIAKFLQPRRQRFELSNTNKYRSENTAIIDPSATFDLRTMAGGLFSGITNPSTKWIRFNVDDPDLNKYHTVRVYLDVCADIVLRVLGRTNFYHIAPTMFSDFGAYSTSSVGMERDELSVIRFYHNPMGTYRLMNDSRNSVGIHARKMMLSTRQMVERFGLDNVSDQVKAAWNNSTYNQKFEINHLVMPNPDHKPGAFYPDRREFASFWIDPTVDDRFISRSGFSHFPFVTPRWEAMGNDSYGSFGPGMLALGSIKGLQNDTRQRFEAQEKMIRPPMVGAPSLKNEPKSQLPGSVTYANSQKGAAGWQPAYMSNLPIQYVLESINDTRQIIKQAFFVDLFLAITNVQKSNTTATEIAQRQEEKLLMLGPVLSRLEEEGLTPVVEMAFSECNRRGLLPPPPEELDGKEIQIEYMGMLQQAQKMVGISSIERTVSFIGNLAGMAPQALDKIDIDATVDVYADITGTTPRIMADDEAVRQIREQRAQAQQAEQAAAMAGPTREGAQAAELLSKTDMGTDNALSRMLGG